MLDNSVALNQFKVLEMEAKAYEANGLGNAKRPDPDKLKKNDTVANAGQGLSNSALKPHPIVQMKGADNNVQVKPTESSKINDPNQATPSPTNVPVPTPSLTHAPGQSHTNSYVATPTLKMGG